MSDTKVKMPTVNFSAELKFTPEQLEQLVKKAILSEYGLVCNNVRFSCRMHYDNSDYMGRDSGHPALSETVCNIDASELTPRRGSGSMGG